MIRRSVKKIAEMLESTAYGNVEQMIEEMERQKGVHHVNILAKE